MKYALLVLGLSLVACSGSDETPSPDGGVVLRDAGPAPALADRSDTFDGDALSAAWSTIADGNLDVRVADGRMSMTVTNDALWFNERRGTAVVQEVRGDFKMTATVHARMTSDPSLPPDRFVHLGGLMARDGRSAAENYVFIVVGWDEQDLSVETKTTVDGVSTYVGPAWPSGDAQLRICRLGSSFVLLKRIVGVTTWTLATTYERPDLPDTLQVGPNAYAVSDPGITPDLTVSFDEVIFADVENLADCRAD